MRRSVFIPWLAVANMALGAATCGPGSVAFAAEKSKVVATLAAAAQKEFDAGKFERAAELFLDIWRRDKTAVPALYNAARASHLAGHLDKADELYREVLAQPGIDAALSAKIAGFQAEIQTRRADQKALEAAKAERDGNYRLAADLWGDACRLAPGKSAWKLRQARAQHLAGRQAEALALYDEYFAGAPADEPGRPDAVRWSAELRPRPAVPAPPATPVSPPTPAAVAVAGAADSGGARWPAWVAVGTGAALVAGGLGLYLAQGDARDQLDAQLAEKSAGKITGIDYQSYDQQRTELNAAYRNAGILAGVGAAAVGAGVWLWLRPPTSVAVVPGPVPAGAALAVRF